MSEPIREILPEEIKTQEAPMRWHGFLTRFMLFLESIVHIIQAALILGGKIYYTAAVRDQVYAGLPGMRIADYALAACLIAAALMQLISRGKLRKWNWQGVQMLKAVYALLALSQVLYALARFFIAGLSPLSIPVIAQVLAYGALLLVNTLYYGRRCSAFGKETK